MSARRYGGRKMDPRSLGRIVEAMTSSDFEPTLANCLAELCPYDNIIFVSYRDRKTASASYRWSRETSVHRNMDSEYLTRHFVLDPAFQIHKKPMLEGVYRLLDIAPDLFRRSEYYRFYYRETTVIDEVILAGHPTPDVTITVCMGRDRTSGKRFSRSEISNLEKWAPVLCPLVNLHVRSSMPPEGSRKILNTGPPEQLSELAKLHLEIDLTHRQAEVALLILQGYSSYAISQALSVSYNTVKAFRKQLYARCNISSQAELFSRLMPLFSML